MKWLSLDFGLSVRLYYEGATEGGFLEYFLGDENAVEFVDLRGVVTQAKGKGLAFADSLRSDRQHNIFSVVILDGDRTDNSRALKAKVSKGDYLGLYLINRPDFELYNFSCKELLDVYLTGNPDASPLLKNQEFLNGLETVNSASVFFKLINRFTLGDHVGKGDRWGEMLAAYANDNPQYPNSLSVEYRPIIEFMRGIIGLAGESYSRVDKQLRTSLVSGRLEPREATSTGSG